jgi:hypothetical protein
MGETNVESAQDVRTRRVSDTAPSHPVSRLGRNYWHVGLLGYRARSNLKQTIVGASALDGMASLLKAENRGLACAVFIKLHAGTTGQ